MNVTEIKVQNIITKIGHFNRAQVLGLNCLIFLAVREQTNITSQNEEMGFEDIPEWIFGLCDQLDDNVLLELTGRLTLAVIMEENAAALDTENAQLLAAQAIEQQFQPTLLSDY